MQANARRTWSASVAGFLSVAVVGVVDHFTDPRYGFSIFYALPVFLTAWYGGLLPGAAVAGLSTVTWLHAQLPAGTAPDHILYWNAGVRAAFFAAVVLLAVTKRRFEQVHQAAVTDFLTGVPNRRGFSELASRELLRARRLRAPVTLAYIDCDDFKRVNDIRGHPVGNRLLVTVAQVLQASVRAGDVAGRLGGDEFAVLLTDPTPDEAAVALGRIRDELLRGMRENSWETTFSIGAVTSMNPPEDLQTLVAAADRLLYRAKEEGKDRIVHEVSAP